ncbi:MAG: hypothetical protein LBR28_05035 [Bacteroidales bacterium]|nr:hypothetical protein [Bacteroidales bacterium]
MIWFKFKNYLKYIYKAKNEYSIHSPFMFETYLKCIKGKTEKEMIEKLNERFKCEVLNMPLNTNMEEYVLNTLKSKNPCMFYLKRIYRDRETFKQWEYLRQQKCITLDINFYYAGLILVKNGLKRQSYILKR